MQKRIIKSLVIETKSESYQFNTSNADCDIILQEKGYFYIYKYDMYGNADLIASISDSYPHVVFYDHYDTSEEMKEDHLRQKEILEELKNNKNLE